VVRSELLGDLAGFGGLKVRVQDCVARPDAWVTNRALDDKTTAAIAVIAFWPGVKPLRNWRVLATVPFNLDSRKQRLPRQPACIDMIELRAVTPSFRTVVASCTASCASVAATVTSATFAWPVAPSMASVSAFDVVVLSWSSAEPSMLANPSFLTPQLLQSGRRGAALATEVMGEWGNGRDHRRQGLIARIAW